MYRTPCPRGSAVPFADGKSAAEQTNKQDQCRATCRGHDSVPSILLYILPFGTQHGDLDYLLADIIKHCGLRDTVPELRKKLLANLMLGSPNGGKKVRLRSTAFLLKRARAVLSQLSHACVHVARRLPPGMAQPRTARLSTDKCMSLRATHCPSAA